MSSTQRSGGRPSCSPFGLARVGEETSCSASDPPLRASPLHRRPEGGEGGRRLPCGSSSHEWLTVHSPLFPRSSLALVRSLVAAM